ncbi:MAG: hypothetical protein ACR2PL_25410 [Dehalococcoidia bacterium]
MSVRHSDASLMANGAATEGEPLSEEIERLRQPLTEEEKQRALVAVEQARRRHSDQLTERGGRPYPPSWELLNELRDERTLQLEEPMKHRASDQP